ncbi:hypothetical protein BDM02DRAFT_1799801 [Thelephora ganbajun]|uniref:Uncharacterized protein n=1 Tax=Thelephora ganbajun TaxID=370292 RepID=A0ACB6Z037_THEGA|nr:hypothetical protein BDM02DRAFT_1799801 [Thelephora ganbajun]
MCTRCNQDTYTRSPVHGITEYNVKNRGVGKEYLQTTRDCRDDPAVVDLNSCHCRLCITRPGVEVSIPASPPSGVTVVKGNFLCVSFESSTFGEYFNSNASGVATRTVNYFTSYDRLLSSLPLKIRIGGRLSDSFTYVEAFGSEGEPKPSDGKGMYGSTVVNVLQNLSKKLGVNYLPNPSLKDPSGQGLTRFATTSKMLIQTI